MSEQENIDLVRENIAAFSASDFDRFRETLSDNSVYHELATLRKLEGVDDIIGALQGWKQAFPDGRGTITNTFASGNQVVAEITWEGTHEGDLVGPQATIPATGKTVTMGATQVVTIENGKITATNHYFDMSTILQQIGAI